MWDRFNICFAYQALENDWNNGGWLPQRPSNQRRRESIGVQLLRMQFSPGMGGGSFDALEWETEPGDGEPGRSEQRCIYVEALARFGMGPLLSRADDSHATIIAYILDTYTAEWITQTFPHLLPVAVTLCPEGAERAEVLARFLTIAEAEAYIAQLHADPTKTAAVERGDYGIDPPEHMA